MHSYRRIQHLLHDLCGPTAARRSIADRHIIGWPIVHSFKVQRQVLLRGHRDAQGERLVTPSFLRRNRHRRSSHAVRGQRHACASSRVQRNSIRIRAAPLNLIIFRGDRCSQLQSLALLQGDDITIIVVFNVHGGLGNNSLDVNRKRS